MRIVRLYTSACDLTLHVYIYIMFKHPTSTPNVYRKLQWCQYMTAWLNYTLHPQFTAKQTTHYLFWPSTQLWEELLISNRERYTLKTRISSENTLTWHVYRPIYTVVFHACACIIELTADSRMYGVDKYCLPHISSVWLYRITTCTIRLLKISILNIVERVSRAE